MSLRREKKDWSRSVFLDVVYEIKSQLKIFLLQFSLNYCEILFIIIGRMEHNCIFDWGDNNVCFVFIYLLLFL